MKIRVLSIPTLLALALAAGLAAPAPAEEKPTPSQMTIGELTTITGEVVAIDPATRHVTLRGPLGGEIAGRVQEGAKNLDQIKAGDMVTIAYYQSVAFSATRKGEPNPLFTGGEAATGAPGARPEAYVSTQVKKTVTVVSVDPDTRSIVFQGENGTLFPVEVKRPEFAQKLQGLRAGDQLDVIVSEAVIAEVTKAVPGQKPAMTHQKGTLIVDRGEVVKRMNNTLIIRNEKGRTVRVTVDPTFKFMLDGKEVTVMDLKEGTRLERTAFRIVESTSFEGE
jgi:hypothetical protein